MPAMLAELASYCRQAGLRPPSRATVYKLLPTLPTRTLRVSELPLAVQQALYNLTGDSLVPAHQVAFYCINYGSLAAVSYAAGLPWLALFEARRLPGYRARCRGLLDAVMHARGI